MIRRWDNEIRSSDPLLWSAGEGRGAVLAERPVCGPSCGSDVIDCSEKFFLFVERGECQRFSGLLIATGRPQLTHVSLALRTSWKGIQFLIVMEVRLFFKS